MSFSIVTWNVLAQDYVKPDRYVGIDPRHLEAAPRLRLLLQRLTALDADVYCLQEVDAVTYDAVMKALPNHEGFYVRKNGKPDGSAIVHRPKVLVRTETRSIHYKAVDPGYDHVAAIAAFTHENRSFEVVSTHLRWQGSEVPVNAHLGLLQLRELLGQMRGKCLVAGDLNAAHGSPVLKEAASRGFQMAGRSLRPWDTALINGRRRKLDYIFYNDATLVPRPHPLPALSRERPIPSAVQPSDHLPLKVDFDWS